jgi:hypothetical protein
VPALHKKMDLFREIDDVVWGETDNVWNDTFALLMRTPLSPRYLGEIVMKCISTKHDEFKDKYYRVLGIMDNSDESESILKLSFHYQRIMFRYRSAYDCCKTMEHIFL